MIVEYDRIRQAISDWGYPEYRYRQLIQTVFGQRIGAYADMGSLPQGLRTALADAFGGSFCDARRVARRAFPQGEKVLLGFRDGNRVEAVALRYRKGWESFCVSSQCGCGLGCKFCATGAIGFLRNLTAREIVDQLLFFHLAGHGLDSVSFMGMGEPLANPNLFDALGVLCDPAYFGLGPRKITLSTVGIPAQIRRMTRAFPQVNLAFSLHSPFDRQRSELMPINRVHPLHEVLGALDEHVDRTRRKLFIAYILIGGVNDTDDHAKAVARLIRARTAHPHLYRVDLIPLNPAQGVSREFQAPSPHRVRRFWERLRAEGIDAGVRAQFGAASGAACGQLCGEDAKRTARRDKGMDPGCDA